MEQRISNPIAFKFTTPLDLDECLYELKRQAWRISRSGYKNIQVHIDQQTFRIVWYEDPHTPAAEARGQLKRGRQSTLISGKAHLIDNKYIIAQRYFIIIGALLILAMLILHNPLMTFVLLIGTGVLLRALWTNSSKHRRLIKSIKSTLGQPIR